jgi:hypothetical protein
VREPPANDSGCAAFGRGAGGRDTMGRLMETGGPSPGFASLARSRGRGLLSLVAGLGLLACLAPFCDVVLAAHPVERTPGIPLARMLAADHDLAASRGGTPRLALPADRAEGPAVPRPEVVEARRAPDPGCPSARPSPCRRPDLSRSPPARSPR